jgi:hypothetical protein
MTGSGLVFFSFSGYLKTNVRGRRRASHRFGRDQRCARRPGRPALPAAMLLGLDPVLMALDNYGVIGVLSRSDE